MRVSQYLLATTKNTPKNCETTSHQLMIKAGLIRQVSAGLYIWLPTGLRIIKKIKKIIREEMNKSGAIEISMPIIQPAKFWKKSGRWKEYGKELLRFKNRNDQDFVLSPTHEEMVSELICKEIISHKQLPLNVYQIHTKYRDEARPRFGIIRSREFIMKDGYSFHINQKSLQKTYENMYDVYHTIFNRIKLNFCVVQADPGKMGGILSHEFQAHSISKENVINNNINNNITKNTNNQQKKPYENKLQKKSTISIESMRLITAPNINSIYELTNKFNISIKQTVKTIIVHTHNMLNKKFFNFIGLVIRGDQNLNHQKVSTLLNTTISSLSFANVQEIYMLTGYKPNILGPINLEIPYIIDCNVTTMYNFVAGSSDGKYLFGVNWNRDIPIQKIADLCITKNHKEITKTNNNIFSTEKYIEVGHIFQLGEKYSRIIHNIQKKSNKHHWIINMGCYGIGITRIIAVIIEQNHDKKGILWPESIAPFRLAIIPINMHHSIHVKQTTEEIYNKLLFSSINTDILMDDRKEHPGTMFADIDLIGVPHILIISDKNLKNQEIEYQNRRQGTIKKIKLNILFQFLTKEFF